MKGWWLFTELKLSTNIWNTVVILVCKHCAPILYLPVVVGYIDDDFSGSFDCWFSNFGYGCGVGRVVSGDSVGGGGCVGGAGGGVGSGASGGSCCLWL